MDLKNVLISVIVVGLVVLAVSTIIGGYNNAYHTTISTDFNTTFNKMAEVTALTQEMSTALETSTTSLGSFLGFMATGAWKVMELMLTIPISLMSSLITILVDIFMLPAWFAVGLIAIVLISIIFAIVYIIFGRK